MKNYVFCVVDRTEFVSEASVQHNVEGFDQETQYNENDTNPVSCSISVLDLNMSSLSNESLERPRNDHVDLTLEAESEPFDTNQTSEDDILDTSKYFKNYEDYDVDKNGFVTNEEELEEEITSDSPYAFDSLKEQENERDQQPTVDESHTENYPDNIKQMYNNKNFERQEVSDENIKSAPTDKPSSGSFKKKFGKFLMHLFLPSKPVYVRRKNRESIPQTSTHNTSSVTVHQHTKLKFSPTVSTLTVKDSDSMGNIGPIKEEKPYL